MLFENIPRVGLRTYTADSYSHAPRRPTLGMHLLRSRYRQSAAARAESFARCTILQFASQIFNFHIPIAPETLQHIRNIPLPPRSGHSALPTQPQLANDVSPSNPPAPSSSAMPRATARNRTKGKHASIHARIHSTYMMSNLCTKKNNTSYLKRGNACRITLSPFSNPQAAYFEPRITLTIFS